MKIVLVMGSHRKARNTQRALEYFISSIDKSHEILIFDVNNMEINICKACGFCEKNFKKCIFDDDISKLFYEIDSADIFGIFTPVYFNGMSTKMKIIADRFQMAYACEKYFGKKFSQIEKKCFLVSLGGAPIYENQFIGSEICGELLFKDIGGTFEKHLKIPDTDNKDIDEMKDVVDELKKLFFVTYMPY